MKNIKDFPNDRPLGVSIEAVQCPADPAILRVLSRFGTEVIIHVMTTLGRSSWCTRVRIDATLDGNPVQYFAKANGGRGQLMVWGEYKAMCDLHSYSPTLVVKPISWGVYDNMPQISFYICEFRNLITARPALETFPAQIASLHRTSYSHELGFFGERFPPPAFHRNDTPIFLPDETSYYTSWERFFTRVTRDLLLRERKVRGPSTDLAELETPFLEKVIPRLLRPMETGGRHIYPTCIHGDLWHGNIAIDADSKQTVLLDATGFLAHNEFDLALWSQPWNEINAKYRAEYHKHFPKSEPAEDADDRHELYAHVFINILNSIHWKDGGKSRPLFIGAMRALVQKYPGGYEAYEEWERQHKSG